MMNFFIPIAMAFAVVAATESNVSPDCKAGLLDFKSYVLNSQASAGNSVCSTSSKDSETAIEWSSSFNVFEDDPTYKVSSAFAKTKFPWMPLDSIREVHATFSFGISEQQSGNSSSAVIKINTGRRTDGSATFVHIIRLAFYNGPVVATSSEDSTVVVNGMLFHVITNKVNDVTTFTYIPYQNAMKFVGNLLDFPKSLPKDSITLPLDLLSIEAGSEVQPSRYLAQEA
ncbi:uncharacterized protein CCR75_005751 [Bremia lactucae]|uniref:Secreted protein n=1 Tax=Bremia lactucae TaxID=4779 RepID=A0A976FG58_BRELC|nr:hypothetical protein CCR75_005751 [Bremia lactucae]